MPLYRIMHTMQSTSQLSEDRFVNNFYANGPIIDTEANMTALSAAVRSFYDHESGASFDSVRHYLSGECAGTGSTVKIYRLNDPVPRPVLFEESFQMVGLSTDTRNLPSEVALCLSYAATPLAGTPPARLRGRVYIGPFGNGALASQTAQSSGRPVPGLQTAMVAGAQAMASAMTAAGFGWVVYSKTGGNWHQVVRCWADNAFDTQRRRGVKPDQRNASVIDAEVGGGGSSGSF